jgi:hypothetical protein
VGFPGRWENAGKKAIFADCRMPQVIAVSAYYQANSLTGEQGSNSPEQGKKFVETANHQANHQKFSVCDKRSTPI